MTPIKTEEKAEVFYFGCLRRVGHFYHSKKTNISGSYIGPWGNSLDGGILNAQKVADRPSAQVIAREVKDGWTAISFWDRSVDTRGACNSAFIALGEFSTAEMLDFAREQWPEVFSRPGFPLKCTPTPATPPKVEVTEEITDKMRLDWLEKQASTFECTSDATDFTIIIAKSRRAEHEKPFNHQTFRDAVDAGLKKELGL